MADPINTAVAAGLRYVNDCSPGITRERVEQDGATTFRYRDADGQLIAKPALLARIERLRIPPAWEDVWICPRANGHIQATGRDARGRKQYRYHADWSATRNQTKYDRLAQFGEALPALRSRIDADLSRRGLPREKVLATLLRLMELTYIRVGNREYARANRSYGLTTLRDKHVAVEGASIRFRFVGKSGQEHAIDVRDQRLARIVRQCRDIPGYELFQYYDDDGRRQGVDSGDVNDYLREVTGVAFSAKDFRTWGGSVMAAALLAERGQGETEAASRAAIVETVRQVAAVLGNRPATCRKYYIHPVVLAAFEDGTLSERWRNAEGADAQNSLSAGEAVLLALLRA